MAKVYLTKGCYENVIHKAHIFECESGQQQRKQKKENSIQNWGFNEAIFLPKGNLAMINKKHIYCSGCFEFRP